MSNDCLINRIKQSKSSRLLNNLRVSWNTNSLRTANKHHLVELGECALLVYFAKERKQQHQSPERMTKNYKVEFQLQTEQTKKLRRALISGQFSNKKNIQKFLNFTAPSSVKACTNVNSLLSCSTSCSRVLFVRSFAELILRLSLFILHTISRQPLALVFAFFG